MPTTDARPVIRKELDLRIDPAGAFALFTDGMTSWWPLASHSVGGGDAIDVAVEGRVGGRIVERTSDGSTHVWGTILAWEPPRRLVATWHPGHPADDATELEVRFEAADGGGCRLVLVHRGWERVTWSDQVAGYEAGWDPVLDTYRRTVPDAASTASPTSPGPA